MFTRIRHIRKCFFFIATVLFAFLWVGPKWITDLLPQNLSGDIAAQERSVECDIFDFNHFIINDARFGPKSRNITVFMNKSLFTEKDLTRLFARLGPKYSDTKILIITVLTDWAQLSDCSATGLGDASDQKPSDPNLLEARYYRDENREHFTYIPEPGKDYVKVDLKRK